MDLGKVNRREILSNDRCKRTIERSIVIKYVHQLILYLVCELVTVRLGGIKI